jgi:hypothetical protein
LSESYLLPTRVECYAGSRDDEAPRALWLEEERLEIEEIEDRWYQGSADPTLPAACYFRVRTTGGERHLLRLDLPMRAWYLVLPSS